MKRRSIIRNLVIFSGGIVLLPACKNIPGNSSIKLRNITVDEQQEKLLAEVVSVIIPQTDTPGAKELNVHLFVLKMLDDLYEKDVQQFFLTGLNKLDSFTKKRFNNSFINCTTEQKEKMLLSIEDKAAYPIEIFDFYKITKQRTIEGYLNSKYVMSTLVKYELIPSDKYDGYYRIKNS